MTDNPTSEAAGPGGPVMETAAAVTMAGVPVPVGGRLMRWAPAPVAALLAFAAFRGLMLPNVWMLPLATLAAVAAVAAFLAAVGWAFARVTGDSAWTYPKGVPMREMRRRHREREEAGR